MSQPSTPEIADHADWFGRASFGLFIHFDQASQLGVDLSWPMVGLTADDGTGSTHQEPVDYFAAELEFDPTSWNPADLARRAASAGMTYAVFTARHHSGWTSWPSRTNPPHTIANSPYGRRGGDLVREFVDAFRNEGLRVGLYFSVSDWTDPDYPAWKPSFAPYSFESYPRSDPDAWERYLLRLTAQLTEVLTDYGTIDILWFDGGWERSEAEWRSGEIESLVRTLQPGIVLNDRLPGVGDYATPEQSVPDERGGRMWEACLTLNHTWGFDPHDASYKTPDTILRSLSECVGLGGNLLLNVGPSDTGALPDTEETVLQEIGRWMSVHRESVIGAEAGLTPGRFYGPSTTVGNDLYLFLTAWPHETSVVRGIRPRRIESVELVTTGEPLHYRIEIDPLYAREEDPVGNVAIDMPATRPDGPLPVVRVRFAEAGE